MWESSVFLKKKKKELQLSSGPGFFSWQLCDLRQNP